MTKTEQQQLAEVLANLSGKPANGNGGGIKPVHAVIGAFCTVAINVVLNYSLTQYRLAETEALSKENAKEIRQQELTIVKLGGELLGSAKNTETQANEARKATDANTTTVTVLRSEIDKLKEECVGCSRRR